MATLNTTNIKHASSGSNNIVLASNGSVNIPTLTTNTNFGKTLQVVSTTKTNKFSTTTSDAWVDITGLSVSITPTSSSSKILIHYDTQMSGTELMFIKIVRGSTDIKIGDEADNRIRCTQGGQKQEENQDKVVNFGGSFLDSPNTTSATTYKIQGRVYGTSQNFKVNSANNDSNISYTGRGASSITVMEIAA
jgi:hypothetical protein